MPRATNAPASRERRKRLLDKAKGYRGRRSKLFRYAKNAVMKAQYWAFRDRKTRKRMFGKLWNQRINAAAREHGLTYGRFISGLKAAGIEHVVDWAQLENYLADRAPRLTTIYFLGLGEQPEDLQPFSAENYAKAVFGAA